MSNVEQEADNSKRNSEESDVVLKNQQMVRVQQMATVEWIQQKRKDKDSADGFALRTSSRGKSSRKHLKPTTGQPAASISSPAQPVASSMHPVASFAYPVDMVSRRKKTRSSEAWKLGANRGKSSRKHLKPTTGQPAASISSPAQPVASSMHPVASFAYPVDMVSRRKKRRSSEAWKLGAKYPVDKETAVARSVVTKNEQQLSEQLLNNLLENIQPFDAINAQDGKNQWLK
ncbi:hypothetical protein F511_16053 [Dorcoceras hygrometricum]|uniref:Uncharacterized protein n=1 Tax=Dorcoceras hygrometricum TaxID=472368 RepID=A0A2Z7DHT3_9LAMI|nr:hypothetical protein F511_16053 [Dorcoceras hygrometricum]